MTNRQQAGRSNAVLFRLTPEERKQYRKFQRATRGKMPAVLTAIGRADLIKGA